MLRTTLTLLLALTVSACGFQLRGAASSTGLPADWRQLHLETGSPNSEFQPAEPLAHQRGTRGGI